MPVLKMYIGRIFIDERDFQFKGNTVRKRDYELTRLCEALQADNKRFIVAGCIPSFVLYAESKMNDPGFKFCEREIVHELEQTFG